MQLTVIHANAHRNRKIVDYKISKNVLEKNNFSPLYYI